MAIICGKRKLCAREECDCVDYITQTFHEGDNSITYQYIEYCNQFKEKKMYIKKCPFCGGTSGRFTHKMQKTAGGYSAVQVGTIRCTKCGATGPNVRSQEYDFRNETITKAGLAYLLKRAVDEWNRRDDGVEEYGELFATDGNLANANATD